MYKLKYKMSKPKCNIWAKLFIYETHFIVFFNYFYTLEPFRNI